MYIHRLYIYIHVHTHTYIYIYIYTHTHIYIYIYIYRFTWAYVWRSICLCVNVCRVLCSHCNCLEMAPFASEWRQNDIQQHRTISKWNMCVCVCVYVCMHTCVCVCVCMHACVYVFIYYASVQIFKHPSTYLCIRHWSFSLSRTHIFSIHPPHTHMHTHIHTDIHTKTHTCMCIRH